MKKVIAGFVILFFTVLITVTIIYVTKSNDVDNKKDEILEIAIEAFGNDGFTTEEANRINELIVDLKEIDNGFWGFVVNDDIQKYPEFAEVPDIYLRDFSE